MLSLTAIHEHNLKKREQAKEKRDPAYEQSGPKYTGDFDRMSYDVGSNRLFVAGEYTATVEVFNLTTGQHQRSLDGFSKPQGFIVLPDQNRLIVADSRAGIKILDLSTYALLDTINLRNGTNTMGYDAASGQLFVQTGGTKGGIKESYFTAVDLKNKTQLGELKFDTDLLKAVAVETNGRYLYTSVTGKGHIAVIDKKTFQIVRTLPITVASEPSSLALDEANQRLFGITRARTARPLAAIGSPTAASRLVMTPAKGATTF